ALPIFLRVRVESVSQLEKRLVTEPPVAPPRGGIEGSARGCYRGGRLGLAAVVPLSENFSGRGVDRLRHGVRTDPFPVDPVLGNRCHSRLAFTSRRDGGGFLRGLRASSGSCQSGTPRRVRRGSAPSRARHGPGRPGFPGRGGAPPRRALR